MNKTELFKYINKQMNLGDLWIERVPSEVSASYFDNPYVNSVQLIKDELMEKVFCDHIDSVCWFLYEWRDNNDLTLHDSDGRQFEFDSIDEYIDYMKEYEGWTDE